MKHALLTPFTAISFIAASAIILPSEKPVADTASNQTIPHLSHQAWESLQKSFLGIPPAPITQRAKQAPQTPEYGNLFPDHHLPPQADFDYATHFSQLSEAEKLIAKCKKKGGTNEQCAKKFYEIVGASSFQARKATHIILATTSASH